MRFLPLFLSLSSGSAVLVGSGSAAIAKLRLLRAAGADVRWFSQDADIAGHAGDIMLAKNYAGRIDVTIKEPLETDLAGALAVVSAAGKELDERVAARARSLNIPVNVVDRPDLSTFIFPAVVDRGDVVVAIGTGGASPVLARRLREKIEAILPSRIGEFAALMRRNRERLANVRTPRFSVRRFWEKIIDGPVGAAFLSGRTAEAEIALHRSIEAADKSRDDERGVVHLVGAGPGDPDLLTLRALNVLQSADVIFYDELVNSDILSRARRDAEQVFVGKRKGQPGMAQYEINQRLAAAAKSRRCVVRLKGGDPFIFGRGGEELEYLQHAGIPVMIVPGITAALGCAAESGLPLTLRNEASRVCFISASVADEKKDVDWSGLADPLTTVVVYMGLSSAAAVQAGLIAAGRNPKTPAAVLARGTRPDSRAAVGTLANLSAIAASVSEGPALLVIGDVVARSLPWKAANASQLEAAA
ncbi:MAG: uroporphyrinogen-III C-methyltransferase [Rhizobiales bacterium]|nr:uroporphyrinogen-III C-methyltransferase [Hyphomicrobiales bacterium]